LQQCVNSSRSGSYCIPILCRVAMCQQRARARHVTQCATLIGLREMPTCHDGAALPRKYLHALSLSGVVHPGGHVLRADSENCALWMPCQPLHCLPWAVQHALWLSRRCTPKPSAPIHAACCENFSRRVHDQARHGVRVPCQFDRS